MNKIIVVTSTMSWLHGEIKQGVLQHAQHVTRYESVIPILEQDKISLIIFDISQSTFAQACSCIEYIQTCFYQIPVLAVVSDLSQTHILELLCSGLDEYIVYPSSRVELKVRVNRLLRIAKLPPTHLYALADSQFCAETGQLLRQGKSIQFRRKEAELLHCLFRYKNQLVKRDTLISFAWNECDEQPTRTTLDVYIRKIRMRMGELSHTLQTVRGFGYVLTEPVHS